MSKTCSPIVDDIVLGREYLFDWFGLVFFANKNKKNFSCHTADSKPVKQEVNGTVILPPLIFPVGLVEELQVVRK